MVGVCVDFPHEPRGGTMEKFLKKYYKQLHFNSMPKDVRARFFEWVKQGTLTDDMQNWVRDYLQHDPANPNQLLIVNGSYVLNNLPDTNNPADLSDAAAKELFMSFQQALSGMAGDLSSFQDSDHQSRDFVNQYFGAGKLFHMAAATNECADGINQISQLLYSNTNTQQRDTLQEYIVKNTKKSDGKPVFESKEKLKELLEKCQRGEYNTDASVQRKIKSIAQTLEDAVGWYSPIDSDSPEYQAIKNIEPGIKNVVKDGAFAKYSVSSTDLANFRSVYAKESKTGLLQILYFNKTIRDRFANYDNGSITGPINKAEGSVNWHDKDKGNYVDPKTSDVLTPLQQLDKWVSDTYGDTIKKYEKLRGASVFRRQEAKDIFAAIDKNKIKPVDGLDGLLKKKSDIEGKINNPVARQHFKWFTETMVPIADKMPKAVAGAWKNGTQMKAVVEQIILQATDPKNDDPHAIEKAETAMEIMTAMKYGMMISKVMDAMKSTEFNMFSDSSLSWNKNEGIQFVTKAFDKSVKVAFMGVGYGITIARNKIQMSGRKFKNKDNQKGIMSGHFNQENNEKQQALRDQNAADQASVTARQKEIQNLERYINNQAAREANYQRLIHNQDAIMNPTHANYDRYNSAQTFVGDAKNNPKLVEYKKLYQELRQLEPELAALKTQFATYTGKTDAISIAEATSIKQKIDRKEPVVNKKSQRINEIKAELRDPNYLNNLRQARADITNLKADHDAYEQASTERNRLQGKYDDLVAGATSRTERYNEATAELAELNNNITERNNALNNWPQQNTNRVLYLENYWNWLQTGQTKTFRFSTKAAQNKFNRKNMNDALLNNFISQHSLAA